MNREIESQYTCSECNNVFKRIYDLRKHVKKFHSEKLLSEIAPLKSSTKTYSFRCDVCLKNFNQKKHLTFHKKTHNDSNNNFSASVSVLNKSSKKCPLCNFTNSSKTQLHTHFIDKHCIKMCSKNFEFSTEEDFQMWKKSVEQNTKSYYVKERGDIVYKSHKSVSYICHRSGFYNGPESHNKRHIKAQGSRKIGGFCPSAIKLLVNLNNQYQVTFIETHVGHTADLGHLNLTTVEREEIAAKIAMKIPFSHILDEVRDKISEDSLQRIHLLTRKDLNNITREFNLQSESVRHPNDAISIEAWVNDMQQSQCVLFYKPQGVTIIKHPQLKSEDFILIIMNEGQAQMLRTFSADCVCIDGTHGLNAYNFELHTLLVLDDLRQGFPTAFMISNRSDQEVMILFFSSIKEKIGYTISPKVFMSDMAEAYYNAWSRVMGAAEFRLFCAWHVDRAWRKNLNLIKTKDKQIEIYKGLRTLLQETDQTAFLVILEEFLKISANDPDTSSFSAYFKENYKKNIKSWAYCYRLHCGLNTNMHLERMHKTLKYIYLEGKHIKRLDKSISCIMRFVKDKLFDRIITLNKGKICSKIKDMRKRHKKSLELDVNLINKSDDGWLVFSSSKTPESYEIHENIKQCECQLVCTDCKVCIHKYSCSCLDSSIRWNMCKHIHLLGRKILDEETNKTTVAPTTHECPTNETQIDEDDNLYIHIDSNKSEAETIYKYLQMTSSSDPLNKKPLREKKEEMKKWFNNIVDTIQSDSQFQVLNTLVAPIESSLKAAALKDSLDPTVLKKTKKIPHNKKIVQQRRLFSTKKKNKKTKKFKNPSTNERNLIAASLLNNFDEMS